MGNRPTRFHQFSTTTMNSYFRPQIFDSCRQIAYTYINPPRRPLGFGRADGEAIFCLWRGVYL